MENSFDNMKNRNRFMGFGLAFYEMKGKLANEVLTDEQRESLKAIEEMVDELIESVYSKQLTPKERKHFNEQLGGSATSARRIIEAQQKMRMVCWTCKSIALKLGINQ